MLNDATWRKMPIDILTNENMSFVESQMPEGFEYAPYMFYQAALRKADDDGIFDLEDGVIFARLMRVPSEKLVFFVANLMGKRKMIARVSASSNKCLLTDWDYPKGTQPRTWAERRAIVQRMIQEEQAHPIINADFVGNYQEEEPSVSFDSEIDSYNEGNSSENDKKSVYGDKIQKNVSQNVFGDKKSENVSKKSVLEREKEREIDKRDREIHTHTEERDRESLREEEREDVSASAECSIHSALAPTEKKQALARKNKNTDSKNDTNKESDKVEPVSESSEPLPSSNTKNNEKVTDALFEVSAILEAFFVANSFGYDAAKGQNSVLQIAERIKALETETVTASKIAQTTVTEFKKMRDSEGVWKDIPLTPAMLLNPKVWAYLLGVVGKKVTKKNQKNTFLEKVKQYEQEALQEQAGLVEMTNQEYIDNGIDPKDPNRFMLLMRAKKAKEAQYEGDIF